MAGMNYARTMRCSRRLILFATLVVAALLNLPNGIPALQADESLAQQYPETISVLQELYGNEVRAGHRYQLYSDVAKADDLVNIAHLFKALSVSEAVHAAKFKVVLESLGVKPQEIDLSKIAASGTRENLKYATNVELAEIDQEYPAYLRRITPELHRKALEHVNYAWASERQHRELIKKIQSGTGMFFSMLVKYFYENDSRYYVNNNCGATVTELPEGNCPICHFPLDTYKEIPKPDI